MSAADNRTALADLLARLPAKPPRFDDPRAIGVSYEMLLDDGAVSQPRGRTSCQIDHLGISAKHSGSGYMGCTVVWINLATTALARADRRAA
jgi:hypothetical protein